VLIEQGLADTTVLPPLDQQLSQEAGQERAKVTYHTWPGATHGGSADRGRQGRTAIPEEAVRLVAVG